MVDALACFLRQLERLSVVALVTPDRLQDVRAIDENLGEAQVQRVRIDGCGTLLLAILELVVLPGQKDLEVLVGTKDVVLDQVVEEALNALDSLVDELGVVLVVLGPHHLLGYRREDAGRVVDLDCLNEPLEVVVPPVHLDCIVWVVLELRDYPVHAVATHHSFIGPHWL